jgi:protein gp37
MSKRLAGRCGYPADDPFKVTFHPDKFLGNNWKDGCRVFVGSMCDLFHENINFRGPEMRRIFGTMTDFPRVFFILLTKRPQRMKDAMEDLFLRDGEAIPTNLFLGVSCENQARADERIPILLEIPAAKRWVSIEPMLGPVDVRPYLPGCWECSGSCGYRRAQEPETQRCHQCGHEQSAPALWGVDEHGQDKCPACGEISTIEYPCPQCNDYPMVTQHPDTPCLDWVVLGGETGPGARPMHPDWARSVRDQCQAAGVPFYFKQWGEWALTTEEEPFMECWTTAVGDKLDTIMARCGKKRSGRLLDGREWRELPGVRP